MNILGFMVMPFSVSEATYIDQLMLWDGSYTTEILVNIDNRIHSIQLVVMGDEEFLNDHDFAIIQALIKSHGFTLDYAWLESHVFTI